MNGKKSLTILVALLAISVVWSGCGSTAADSGDDEGGSSSISTIDELPRATSPVVESSASLATALGMKDATTGIVLGDLTETTFDESSSIAACEATNKFKDAISSAAQGDMILCYVQNSIAANPDLGIDMYDGNYHVIGLDFGDSEDQGPDKVKMRIVRDAGGNITDFVMFACASGEQNEYLHQSIEDGSFSMTSKGFHQSAEGSGTDHVTVTGTLEGSQFISKTIVSQHSWTENGGGGTNYSGSTVIQEPDAVTYDGYDAGTYTNGEEEGSYSNRAYASAQLIDSNTADDDYNIQLLAIGDGAAHAILSGSNSVWGEWNDDVVQGWNGDTTEEDATVAATYITAVQDHTPVAAGVEPEISFGEDETDDCSDAAEATITMDMEAMDAACSNYSLGHDWVNCWEITGQNE